MSACCLSPSHTYTGWPLDWMERFLVSQLTTSAPAGVCVCVRACVCACMCVCMCVCACVYRSKENIPTLRTYVQLKYVGRVVWHITYVDTSFRSWDYSWLQLHLNMLSTLHGCIDCATSVRVSGPEIWLKHWGGGGLSKVDPPPISQPLACGHQAGYTQLETSILVHYACT